MKKESLLNLIKSAYLQELKKIDQIVIDIINQLWKENNFSLAREIKEIRDSSQQVGKANK